MSPAPTQSSRVSISMEASVATNNGAPPSPTKQSAQARLNHRVAPHLPSCSCFVTAFYSAFLCLCLFSTSSSDSSSACSSSSTSSYASASPSVSAASTSLPPPSCRCLCLFLFLFILLCLCLFLVAISASCSASSSVSCSASSSASSLPLPLLQHLPLFSAAASSLPRCLCLCVCLSHFLCLCLFLFCFICLRLRLFLSLSTAATLGGYLLSRRRTTCFLYSHGPHCDSCDSPHRQLAATRRRMSRCVSVSPRESPYRRMSRSMGSCYHTSVTWYRGVTMRYQAPIGAPCASCALVSIYILLGWPSSPNNFEF